MKKLFLLLLTFIYVYSFSSAQENETKDEPYKFKTVFEVPHTPIKNQYRSGTCWTFASASFIESELIRLDKGEFNISEMFFVRNAYHDHAKAYVRFHGHLNFSAGAEGWDVMNVIRKYGLVTEDVYPGLKYGETNHVHGEMDNLLKVFVDGVIENKNKKLTPVWLDAFDGILDTYLGESPNEFYVNEKKYTPISFRDDIGFNPDNYIALTSFTHHPFYSEFIFESPDNWSFGSINNYPIDELIKIMDNALEKGYSIAWAADVSEKGFSHRNGLAIVPDLNIDEPTGMEKDKWVKLSSNQKSKYLLNFDNYVTELNITQEMRQKAYDNYETTDDHLMHIIGLARDSQGNKYYIVKNSWGIEGSKYDGIFYASEAYVKYKTMSIMLHKDCIK